MCAVSEYKNEKVDQTCILLLPPDNGLLQIIIRFPLIIGKWWYEGWIPALSFHPYLENKEGIYFCVSCGIIIFLISLNTNT
jgi:hypothetical protein